MAVITLEYAKNLANKGFTNEQAEALALEINGCYYSNGVWLSSS